MTQTTTLSAPPDDLADTTLHPSEVLMNLVVAFLAPMFIGASGGDIHLARLAAFGTVTAYTGRNHADLIAIAQIIAYGLAALGSLSLSMEDGLSLAMILRLRGNANACTRSAECNRRALDKSLASDPAPRRPETADLYKEVERPAYPAAEAQNPAPEVQANLQPTQDLTREDPRRQATWAAAMADVAAEFTASLADLPPAERKQASHRAALLRSCAQELLSGTAPPGLTSSIGPDVAQFRDQGARHLDPAKLRDSQSTQIGRFGPA